MKKKGIEAESVLRQMERMMGGSVHGETIEETAKALSHAKEVNGFVVAYILGHRKLPKATPGSYSPGSREEAMIAWEILMPAWKHNLEALKWLKAHNRAQG